MIKKYRKKPVIIEAIQYNGLNLKDVEKFAGEYIAIFIDDGAWRLNEAPPKVDVTVTTLEGQMKVSKGDYIIKGVKGEFYPCKPDIFEQTYEIVEE